MAASVDGMPALCPGPSTPITCRYIQAATSPKDIIIMVDISGSMKGLKMTIAKHTINTILDTLGENDFVNVIAVRIHTCTLLFQNSHN